MDTLGVRELIAESVLVHNFSIATKTFVSLLAPYAPLGYMRN